MGLTEGQIFNLGVVSFHRKVIIKKTLFYLCSCVNLFKIKTQVCCRSSNKISVLEKAQRKIINLWEWMDDDSDHDDDAP